MAGIYTNGDLYIVASGVCKLVGNRNILYIEEDERGNWRQKKKSKKEKKEMKKNETVNTFAGRPGS